MCVLPPRLDAGNGHAYDVAMPQRPRSHELEDLSIDRFLVLRPLAWAARRKSADYGVDLEFEIFGPDNHATGLLFFAQLRATDRTERARSLSLTIEQLRYFEQLPVPTIIVRYAASEDAFYWQWHFNIIGAMKLAEGQKSFTYVFTESERWNDGAPAAIERTLALRKLISSYPPTASVALRIDTTVLASAQRYIVESGISDALEASRTALRLADADPVELVLDVVATPDGLRVALDCIASVLVRVESHDRGETAASMLYCATSLLSRQGLGYQAQRLARAALTLGRPYHARMVAADAAICLLGELDKAVDLALLNGIHAVHDEHYAIFVSALLTASERGDEYSAELRFFKAALAAAAEVSAATSASVHYSIGNFFHRTQPARAVSHYNRARKLRSAYGDSDYFLRELGACLFGTRHYRAAAACYARAMAGGSSALDQLHLGDTYFFSGDLVRAKAAFETAAQDESLLLSSEAKLKLLLCTWLGDRVGSLVVPVRATEASALLRADAAGSIELWERLICEVDATNEIAHFNLAVANSRAGNFNDALGGFLLCAFKQSGDLESWANAVICCQNSEGDAPTLLAVLATSISLAGRQSYDHLRDRLIEQGAKESLLELLDDAARTLAAMREGENGGLVVRALGDAHYDVTVAQLPD